MSWREFDYLSTGYERRLQRNWDYTRHIIASNYNSSGFAKKQTKITDVMKLPLLDTKPAVVFREVSKDRLKQMLLLAGVK